MPTPYVFILEQILHDGAMEKYLPAIVENARASLRDEPGCKRFDVLRSSDSPNSVFLYEVYVDEAAFEAHRKAPHYLKFDGIRKDLVKDSKRTRFTLENP
jgi:(4S)-4-hydroxy-5-phosphonooxypentane-2,3-dione isomerase